MTYYHRHLAISVLISTLAWGWTGLTDALLAGPIFYAAREINQWLAGNLGYDWPTWLNWLLGRPNPDFDGRGFAWGVLPMAVLWSALIYS